MKAGFKPGIAREVTAVVTEDMCPAFEGEVIHRCYSTWSMVHHMEVAARRVLVEYLEDDEEAVGVHVSVDHLAPCRLGKTVRLRAELTDVSDRRVTCDITAYDGDRILARGKQVQVVMNKDKLADLIERS